MKKLVLMAALILLAACQAPSPTASPSPASPAASPTIPPPSTPTATPPDVNPLTGQHVLDSKLLKIPALLVSISHFPATGRPQAGLSFAPFVYEIYITEGATRFLAVFYGGFPAPEAPLTGGCEVRWTRFVQTGLLLGNRVWLDSNANGALDLGEGGVPGVCVALYNEAGNLMDRTTTDSNGYYGFNVEPGRYTVEFAKPPGMEFSARKTADEAVDSDADPLTGRAEAQVQADNLDVDAGLVPSTSVPSANLPAALVGPIRSGRLVYGHLADFFPNSCLIYAFASEEVLARIPQCYMVFHQLEGGGYMLDLPTMQSVALDNKHKKNSDFDYASNPYSAEPPPGGEPASVLEVYIAYQNQSGWVYDPLYRAYLRLVDTSEYDKAGILHPDVDRLTGRQLHFENVVVVFAEHEVVSPTNLDIHLDKGRSGRALLFRNGRMYNIRWSTRAQDDLHKDRSNHPIVFIDQDGAPIALNPGHTWVLVVTPETTVEKQSPGLWQLRFLAPAGAK